MNLADIPNPLAAVVCHLFSVCLLLCIAVLEDEELLVNAAPMMSLQQSGSASAAGFFLYFVCIYFA
jgi:hypothetical protein